MKRTLTGNDLRRFVYYQKLENDAQVAKENKEYEKAIGLMTEALAGYKGIIAEHKDAKDGKPFVMPQTDPNVSFQSDEATRKIFKEYFGINVTDLNKEENHNEA